WEAAGNPSGRPARAVAPDLRSALGGEGRVQVRRARQPGTHAGFDSLDFFLHRRFELVRNPARLFLQILELGKLNFAVDIGLDLRDVALRLAGPLADGARHF